MVPGVLFCSLNRMTRTFALAITPAALRSKILSRCPSVYAAGSLDRDGVGLIILTNAGKRQARLTHPAQKTAKIDQVQGKANLMRPGWPPTASA